MEACFCQLKKEKDKILALKKKKSQKYEIKINILRNKWYIFD